MEIGFEIGFLGLGYGGDRLVFRWCGSGYGSRHGLNRVRPPKSCHLPGLSLALWINRYFHAQRPEPEPANLLLPELFTGLRSLKSLDLRLTFINCLCFLEDEEGKITEGFLLDSLLENGGKITENSLPDIQFQPLWQSYMEDHIRESEEFYSVLNQIQIPTWFNHQNRGSYVSIPLHQYDSNWTGIALCVDIKVQKNLSEVSPGDPTDFHEFYLEMHGGLEDFPRNYKFPRDKIHVGSFGIWLYISHAKLGVLLHGCDDIRPFIKTNSPDIEIKGCGARILYERDLVQFVQILSQQIFGNGRFLAGS
ncbi:hypothetical protein CMV_021433 [Castanea mollissima]|uniref:C-JID domain-containing protein n=1 Tax=Castanea mollissima TaxID=60419 RepID=A0A8J4VCM6_9ROSI|nr:hypothetical protein CMV_021433 [Castanea mollissima]